MCYILRRFEAICITLRYSAAPCCEMLHHIGIVSNCNCFGGFGRWRGFITCTRVFLFCMGFHRVPFPGDAKQGANHGKRLLLSHVVPVWLLWAFRGKWHKMPQAGAVLGPYWLQRRKLSPLSNKANHKTMATNPSFDLQTAQDDLALSLAPLPAPSFPPAFWVETTESGKLLAALQKLKGRIVSLRLNATGDL